MKQAVKIVVPVVLALALIVILAGSLVVTQPNEYTIIKQAEAYRESKINEAEGQAARFSELFGEYQNYPLITKQRLFYEAMEEILPDMKLYIVDANTGVQTALPLESFANINTAAAAAEGGASN